MHRVNKFQQNFLHSSLHIIGSLLYQYHCQIYCQLNVGIEWNESEHLFEKEKQRCDYNRHNQVPNKIKVGQKVLLKNQRRMDRKVGNF